MRDQERLISRVMRLPLVVNSYGHPDQRPLGNPCFSCGAQIYGESKHRVRVFWSSSEQETVEQICNDHASKYGHYLLGEGDEIASP